MPTIREAYAARKADADASTAADQLVVEDKAKLTADTTDAQVKATSAAASDKAFGDLLPEGRVFVVEPTVAAVKVHGEALTLPIGDPNADPTPPAEAG